MKFPIYTQIANPAKIIWKPINPKAFDYPFFNDGVLATNPEIKNCDKEKSITKSSNAKANLLVLKGFVFHTSHCGSTLLSRALSTSKRIRVVSEPEAINGLLLAYIFHDIKRESILEQLAQIINGFRQTQGPEQYVVFKLTSWNIFMADLFLELFPEIPWFYIDRETSQVVASLNKSKGAMQSWFNNPNQDLTNYFSGNGYEFTTKLDYLTNLVKRHRAMANTFKNKSYCKLFYPEFLNEFEEVILPHLKLEATSKELMAIKDALNYNSKSFKKEPFVII